MIQQLSLSAMVCTLLIATASCQGQSPGQSLPYDLSSPEVIELSSEVSEISGIAYYAPRHSVFAIDDDHGNVYEIPLVQQPTIQQWPFGVPEDFEDIVLEGNMLYVLSSKGRLAFFPVAFPIQNPTYSALATTGKNDFETLFKDPSSNRLMLICKQCDEDKKKQTSVFAFDLAKKEFMPEAVAVIRRKSVNAEMDHPEIKNLKPSAAAPHPQTGDIYLLASVNKLLLILDAQLNIQAVHPLNPKIFKQPEGITFTPEGDLLISNEAGKKGKANILIFRKR